MRLVLDTSVFVVEMSEVRRYKYLMRLPMSLKETVDRLAREDGVSLNQWITAADSHKTGAVETADVLLSRRATTARVGDLLRYLGQAPYVRPVPGDELPEV